MEMIDLSKELQQIYNRKIKFESREETLAYIRKKVIDGELVYCSKCKRLLDVEIINNNSTLRYFSTRDCIQGKNGYNDYFVSLRGIGKNIFVDVYFCDNPVFQEQEGKN